MQKITKICFVSLFTSGIYHPEADLKFGGSETQMYFLARELAKNQDFSVNMVVLDFGQADGEVFENVTLRKAYKRGGSKLNIIVGFFKLMLAIRRANPDVIVCRAFGREVGVSALYAKIFRKKLVYSYANDQDGDGTFFMGLAGEIFKYGFINADFYIAQTEFQKEYFSKLYHRRVGDIAVIKNSWPIAEFSPVNREFVLWVGSSADLKQPEIFLDLATAIPTEKFVMIMTRSKMNSQKWDDINTAAVNIPNLKIIPSVPFLEIDEYFSKAKVLVNTSFSEGFPNIFLQAARAKTPILTLKIDPDKFIEKCDCGSCFDNDYEELLKELKILLANPETATIKGANAYQYFLAEHAIEKNILLWEELLKNL